MPEVEVAPDIVVYYQRMGERSRLTETGAGRLEFLRTWDVLGRVLPKPPATVLDVGGATGVYAGPLATAGYRVHVVDPVAEQVAAASALPGVTAVGVEGPLWTMTEPLAATLDEPDLMLDLLRTIETEPSILGASAHILAVAQRPA